MAKSNEEVEALKKNWVSDPCWDIEATEGFEEYADALKAFRLEKEAEWQAQFTAEMHSRIDAMLQRTNKLAEQLGCKPEIGFAIYALKLEQRVAQLEEKLHAFMNREA